MGVPSVDYRLIVRTKRTDLGYVMLCYVMFNTYYSNALFYTDILKPSLLNGKIIQYAYQVIYG